MAAYIARRLLLMIPTILGIMLISFVVVQFAPGGPVERVIAQLQGYDMGATSRFSGGGGDVGRGGAAQIGAGAEASKYRGAQGLDPKFIAELEKQFGFDKPAWERFLLMVKNYAIFDFGRSYFRDESVLKLIGEKLPVSISLGLWMTLHLLFDLDSARHRQGGARRRAFRHLDLQSRHRRLRDSELPLRHAADRAVRRRLLLADLSAARPDVREFRRAVAGRKDRRLSLAHLPAGLAMTLGAFATQTFLTKNSFLDEIRKQYVQTARMKGLTENRVLYGHVFRNAMLIVVSGFPGAFVHAFFTGSLLIETIFSLDGLGYLSFESIVNRDYPVVFANLYIFALLGLVVNLLSDLTYTWIDPRIDFETREV